MCKTRPGIRCDDHIHKSASLAADRLSKKQEELNNYRETYFESLTTETPNGRDLIRQAKHEKLMDEEALLAEKENLAYTRYNATKAGQDELKTRLENAEKSGNIEEAHLVSMEMEAAEEFANQTKADGKELISLEKNEGEEVAYERSQEILADATAENLEATAGQAEAEFEMNVAKARLKAEQEAYEALVKQKGILSPEEEAARRRKKRALMILVGTAVTAYAAYSLVKMSSEGQQSSMMNYGRSFAMRQITQHAGSLFRGNKEETNSDKISVAQEESVNHGEQVENQLREMKKREEQAEEAQRQKLEQDRQRAAERATEEARRKYEKEQEQARRQAEKIADKQEREIERKRLQAEQAAMREQEREQQRQHTNRLRTERLQEEYAQVQKMLGLPLTESERASIISEIRQKTRQMEKEQQKAA